MPASDLSYPHADLCLISNPDPLGGAFSFINGTTELKHGIPVTKLHNEMPLRTMQGLCDLSKSCLFIRDARPFYSFCLRRFLGLEAADWVSAQESQPADLRPEKPP